MTVLDDIVTFLSIIVYSITDPTPKKHPLPILQLQEILTLSDIKVSSPITTPLSIKENAPIETLLPIFAVL